MAKNDLIVRLLMQTKDFDSSLQHSSKEIRDFKKNCESMASGIDSFSNSLNMPIGKLTTLTGALGLLGTAIVDNIKTAAEFEKSMSNLSALTGLAGDELKSYADDAIRLGSTTTQSASQVVESFKNIGSAMPQLLESREALVGVTQAAITLSEAASMEVSDASKAMANAMNQFGLEATEADRVINVLAASSQKGAGDISYLSEAIVNCGTFAAASNVSLEETAAALEVLAQKGIDASTAGNNLKNIFIALESQSDDSLKPSVVGLQKALENLKTKVYDVSTATAMFGKQHGAAALALVQETEKMAKLRGEITNTNTAQEQAEVNTNNFSGAVNKLSSAWEGLNLTLNQSNGILTKLVNNLADATTAATEALNALNNLDVLGFIGGNMKTNGHLMGGAFGTAMQVGGAWLQSQGSTEQNKQLQTRIDKTSKDLWNTFSKSYQKEGKVVGKDLNKFWVSTVNDLYKQGYTTDDVKKIKANLAKAFKSGGDKLRNKPTVTTTNTDTTTTTKTPKVKTPKPTKGKTQAQLEAEEKQRQANLALLAKDYIANQEAKLGADWKYTTEGVTAYEKYFDTVSKIYKKDSQEWKENQREKWEYERESRDRAFNQRTNDFSYFKEWSNTMKGENYIYTEEGKKEVLKWYDALLDYVEKGTEEERNLLLDRAKYLKQYTDSLEDAAIKQRDFNKEISKTNKRYIVSNKRPTQVSNDYANSVNSGFNAQVNSLAVQYNNELGKGAAADTKRLRELKDAINEVREAQTEWNKLNVASGTDLDIMVNKTSNLTSSISSFASNLQSFEDLGDKFANANTALDKFVLTMQLLNGVLQTYNEIQAIAAAVTELFTAKKETETAVTTASAVAKEGEAVATTTQIAADTAEAATSTANAAAKGAETTKTIASAIAKLFEASAAAGPFGIAIAAGSVAVMIAAIGAAIGMAQGFANGGIVGGTDYSGDKRTIRVNSGEMILNKRQQQNLFNMINNGGVKASYGGQVEFKLRGQELVGLINNYSTKRGRSL